MLGQASDVMKAPFKKDYGFLLVCTPANQAQRPLLLGPCRATETNRLPCVLLLSRACIWVTEAPLSSRSVNYQPELLKDVTPGSFCVRRRRLSACCFCRVGEPWPGASHEPQSWNGSLEKR